MEEIVVKYLDIDVGDAQARLAKIGAKKVSDGLIRQKVYDYPDLRLNKMGAWIRLREEDGKITLTYKKRLGMKDGVKNDEGMEEVEAGVEDFEKTAMIFEKAGMYLKFYEEKKRITYKKGKLKFDIDIWPILPAYLEIEGESWAELDGAARLLGLDPKNKKILSAMQIFDLYGLTEMDYEVLTFEKQIKRQVRL